MNLISSRINHYNALTNGRIKHPNLFIRKKNYQNVIISDKKTLKTLIISEKKKLEHPLTTTEGTQHTTWRTPDIKHMLPLCSKVSGDDQELLITISQIGEIRITRHFGISL